MVETDKASVEVPSPFTGSVQEINVAPGDIVSVGDGLLVFGNGEAPPEEGKKAAAEVEEEQVAEETGEKQEIEAYHSRPVPASPATRRLARELDVDLRQVSGSAPAGRVTSKDVRAHAEKVADEEEGGDERRAKEEKQTGRVSREERGLPAAAPAPSLPDFGRWGDVQREPLRSVRRTTARRMAQSWSQIPHVSHEDTADVTDLDLLRQKSKEETDLQSLSLMMFVMKAAVGALKAHPRFNASLDVEAEEIILKHYYHLGVAVDTERGLIVPVVRDVDRKSIRELSTELQELVQRTRDEEISLEEMQGGTFTITNVGVIGGTGFAPIINFPQVAILGMARAAWHPVVIERNGRKEVKPRYLLPLMMSFDHRVIDGADAAYFMRYIVETLEDPNRLMLEV